MAGWSTATDKCPKCNVELTDPLDRIMGVCPSVLCRGPFLAKRKREQEEARRTAEKAMIDHIVASLDKTLEPPLLSAVTECQSAGRLAKVPDGNLPSCQLPEDRRRKFTEHLRTTLERALLIIADPSASRSALIDYAHRDQESEKAPVLPVINGCTTCRGFCCRSGGETAFLTPGHFAWQMLSDPTLTTEAMERWYLNQLPEISMENSCVYHSERGCSIPRRQRASICNDFHCWGLQGVLAEHQDGDQVDWVAFAASETEAKRVSIMLSNGERTERDMLLRLDDSNE